MRLAVVVAGLAGCSGSLEPQPPRTDACAAVAWSCVTLVGDTPVSCIEGDASQRATHEAACAQGAFTLGGCPRDAVVGGCTRVRGATCTTTWFHARSAWKCATGERVAP